MQIRSAPFRWLGLVLTVLASTPAGADDAEKRGVRVAQAEPEATNEEQAPAPSPAGSGVEEIIVRGGESATLADIATGDSVTAFNVADLAALGAQSIEDLASFTPNLEIVTAGATTPTFFIRGVGLNDFNPNSTGAVAIYQDDVAINAPALQLGTLFDVEGVNVLRGPQGTGVARNASAGAIKIHSRKPTGQFGGYLRSEFGNYDFQDYEGAVEAPMYKDLLSGRLAFRLTQRDGTMKNRCGNALPLGQRQPQSGASQTRGPWSQCGEAVSPSSFLGPSFSNVPFGLEDRVNNTDNWAARGTLLFEPTLDLSFLLNAHGARRDELSRLGQSIGTSGVFCTDPTRLCTGPPLDTTTGRFFDQPGEFDRSLASAGLLGGAQGLRKNIDNGYQAREIRARWGELAPCLVATDPSNGCSFQSFADRLAANRALIQVADELAKRLDSRPWEGDFNFTGPTTNDVWGAYVKGDYVLPANLELKTTTAYDTYDRFIATDLDFSPETLFHITTDDEAWQAYQDLALSGELGEELGLRWEVGGWYLREELDVLVKNELDPSSAAALGVTQRDYSQDTDSAAGYASFGFDFWDDFTLDGGYRYNWEEKDFGMRITGGLANLPEGCSRVGAFGSGISDCVVNETWNASSGTLRLLYRFREDTHVSWRYTRGWKPGSINATASQLTGPSVAEPEEIDAFELGLHGSWFGGRFGMDASLFYYSYSQYQIFIARQLFGASPEFVLLNANDAEVYGSEIDAIARPWVGAFVNVRFSWLESQFLDFLRRDQFLKAAGGASPVQFRETQASGNPLLNSPHYKVSITAEQSVPLGPYGSLSLRYDGVWTDTTYYDANKGRGVGDDQGNLFLPKYTIAQRPYWLHNLRLGWRTPDGRLELAGWVRNLENTAYKSYSFDGSAFQSTTIHFVGDPRTYGVSVRVDF